ncbi:MAG: hypothetical protein ABL932_15770 [Terricaulis sp.]
MADRSYPGALATPAQVQALADEYRKATRVLLELGRRGAPLTYAPFRLTAIHAVELYLNAFLLRGGHAPGEIRRLQHDLWARAELALAGGLQLRKRTSAHLRSLNAKREYLASRYGPELAATMSQINRLGATLEEVATKTTKAGAIPSANPVTSEGRPRGR